MLTEVQSKEIHNVGRLRSQSKFKSEIFAILINSIMVIMGLHPLLLPLLWAILLLYKALPTVDIAQ